MCYDIAVGFRPDSYIYEEVRNSMKRKIFTVLIAMVLMILIAAGAIGVWLNDKYSYGTDIMALKDYFGVEEGHLAVYLQEQKLQDQALLRSGICYLDQNFVKKYLNDIFYVDMKENAILYTDAAGIIRTEIGTDRYSVYGEEKSFAGTISFLQDDKLYLALPYVAMFSDFDYDVYDYRLQLTTSWDSYQAAALTKNTKVRYRGGIKSEILCQVEAGEMVQILEVMETWTKVKTKDCIIGYVENKLLGEEEEAVPEKKQENRGYTAPEYTTVRMNEKICLGWHAIGGAGGNVTLEEMVVGAPGMNVIAPTWFSLNDNEGGFRNFGGADYVARAHSYGLQVWGVWDDFNFENETSTKIDDTLILSTESIRNRLVQNIMDTAAGLGLDGINLDFEKVGSDCKEAYGQFIRELSVECRKAGICFSVDNYMPNEGNKQYRLDVQGVVTDYVILMGYDEHWHGSSDPGSVASIGFVKDGITKSLRYVPADKLVNALPFYTIFWKIDGTAVADEYLTLVNQADFLSKISATPVWDEETCQNYVEWTSDTRTFKLWLEDAESISVKLNVMRANDLAGVAVWRLGYGTPDIWNLVSAFKNM